MSSTQPAGQGQGSRGLAMLMRKKRRRMRSSEDEEDPETPMNFMQTGRQNVPEPKQVSCPRISSDFSRRKKIRRLPKDDEELSDNVGNNESNDELSRSISKRMYEISEVAVPREISGRQLLAVPEGVVPHQIAHYSNEEEAAFLQLVLKVLKSDRCNSCIMEFLRRTEWKVTTYSNLNRSGRSLRLHWDLLITQLQLLGFDGKLLLTTCPKKFQGIVETDVSILMTMAKAYHEEIVVKTDPQGSDKPASTSAASSCGHCQNSPVKVTRQPTKVTWDVWLILRTKSLVRQKQLEDTVAPYVTKSNSEEIGRMALGEIVETHCGDETKRDTWIKTINRKNKEFMQSLADGKDISHKFLVKQEWNHTCNDILLTFDQAYINNPDKTKSKINLYDIRRKLIFSLKLYVVHKEKSYHQYASATILELRSVLLMLLSRELTSFCETPFLDQETFETFHSLPSLVQTVLLTSVERRYMKKCKMPILVRFNKNRVLICFATSITPTEEKSKALGVAFEYYEDLCRVDRRLCPLFPEPKKCIDLFLSKLDSGKINYETPVATLCFPGRTSYIKNVSAFSKELYKFLCQVQNDMSSLEQMLCNLAIEDKYRIVLTNVEIVTQFYQILTGKK